MKTRVRKPHPVEAFLPPAVRKTFGAIRIAEREIRREYPGRDEPRDLFLACRMPPLLQELRPEMYTAHVRELVQRSRLKRPDYAPATEAEILAALLRASLKAPLNRAGMVVADGLCERLLGWRFTDEPTREEWPGQFEEELTAARRTVRTPR